MAHAVSAFYVRSDHMSPLAAFLAAALHVTTALALFWVSPLNRHDLDDDAVEITMEQPKPAETPPEKPPEKPPVQEAVKSPPPPPPPPAPTPQPTPPAAEIAPPPPPPAAAAKLEPKAEAKPQAQAASDKPLGVSPPAPAKDEPPKPGGSGPEPQKEAAAPPQQEAAASPPPPSPNPAGPPLEKVIPPVEAPPAPLTMRDFVRVLPPPSMAHVAPPPPQQTPQPPRAALQPLEHSPLSPAPQPQTSPSASVSTFVNPADEAGHTRAKDAYLWQVIRKFSQYLPDLRDKNEGGTVVLRFVIARDGRLVDASIVKSSGVLALDRGLLESLRAASPYPPLPPEISGDRVVFTQPIAAKR